MNGLFQLGGAKVWKFLRHRPVTNEVAVSAKLEILFFGIANGGKPMYRVSVDVRHLRDEGTNITNPSGIVGMTNWQANGSAAIGAAFACEAGR